MNQQQPGHPNMQPANAGTHSSTQATKQHMEYICAGTPVFRITTAHFRTHELDNKIVGSRMRFGRENPFVAENVVIASCIRRGQRAVRSSVKDPAASL